MTVTSHGQFVILTPHQKIQETKQINLVKISSDILVKIFFCWDVYRQTFEPMYFHLFFFLLWFMFFLFVSFILFCSSDQCVSLIQIFCVCLQLTELTDSHIHRWSALVLCSECLCCFPCIQCPYLFFLHSASHCIFLFWFVLNDLNNLLCVSDYAFFVFLIVTLLQ